MRKCLSIALAMAVLIILSGCATPSAPPIETPDSPPIETPSVSPLPAPSGTVSGGVYLPSGVLPEAEYSAQAPPERYYAGQVSELVPSPEYGQILPFIGGYATGMGMPSEIIGICDANGKIICDPAYNDFEIIEEQGQTLYAFIKYDRVPGDHYEFDDLYITTLASPDGSLVETYDSVRYREASSREISTVPDEYGNYRPLYWRDTVRYDYITARRDEKWGVLDWDGSVLLPFKYNEPVCFKEGLAAILSDDGITVSFIDISGKIILGPYDAPPRPYDEWDYYSGTLPVTDRLMFCEGFARVYADGKFGMIDKTGKIAVPTQHDYITAFSGGTALVINVNPGSETRYRFSIVNSTGKIIIEDTDYEPSNNNGEIILYDYVDYAYLPAQTVDYNGNRTPYVQEEQSGGFNGIETGPEGSTVHIGDRELFFPNGYAEPLYNHDDSFIVFDRDTQTWRLYGPDGEPLTLEQPGVGLHWQYRNNDGYLRITTPETEYSFTPFFLYDFDGKLVIEGCYRAVVPVLDMFMFRTKNTAGLMDKDGNRIIEVSITRYNED